MTWHDRASCRGMSADLFFGEEGRRGGRPTQTELVRVATAKRVCARCPVMAECHEAGALEQGIWGGLTAGERSPRWARAAHGTRVGYEIHLREGTTPCRRCRDAQAHEARFRRSEAHR